MIHGSAINHLCDDRSAFVGGASFSVKSFESKYVTEIYDVTIRVLWG